MIVEGVVDYFVALNFLYRLFKIIIESGQRFELKLIVKNDEEIKCVLKLLIVGDQDDCIFSKFEIFSIKSRLKKDRSFFCTLEK